MLANFTYFRILIFDHSSEGDTVHSLACCACVVVFWKTPWRWHAGAETRYEFDTCYELYFIKCISWLLYWL